MKNINKQIVDLPNGTYDALWTGFSIKVITPTNDFVYVETSIGVKGINCIVQVKIINGLLSVIS